MLAELHKNLDRVLTFPSRNRPDTQAYWNLLSLPEQQITRDLITLLSQSLHSDFRLVVTLMGSIGRYYDHHLLRKIGVPPRQPQDIDLMVTADPNNDHIKLQHSAIETEYERLTTILAHWFLSEGFTVSKTIATSPFSQTTTTAVQFLTDARPTDQLRPLDLVLFRLLDEDSTWRADYAAQLYRTQGVRLHDARDPDYAALTKKKLDARHQATMEMADAYSRY